MGLDALSNDAMQSDMMKSNKYDRRQIVLIVKKMI